MSTDNIKPEFLKKLDQYLLTHFPVIWQSKIIWVAFYSLSLFGVFMLFGDYFDWEPLHKYYAGSHYNYYYHNEHNDRLIFSIIPLFLSILMLFFWLYTQFQQKIDYSSLSGVGFLSNVFLNFSCVVLIFLPAIGLSYSTLDLGNQLHSSLEMIQRVLMLSLAASILPFIMRQYSLIEMVLVVFVGFAYCIGLLIVATIVFEAKGEETITGILVVNFLFFTGVVIRKFATRTYTQQTKRLALLCVLVLPLIVPAFIYYTGYHNSMKNSYDFALGFKGKLFSIKWLVTNVLSTLVLYGVIAHFMYRKMLFPIRSK